MKKTLITLLAMATCATSAQAVTWDSDYTYLDITSTTNTIALQNGPESLTAVLTLNLDAFKNATALNAPMAKYMLVEFQGSHEVTTTNPDTQETTTSMVSHSIGLQTNYSSYDHDEDSNTDKVIRYSGLYGTWQGGKAYTLGMNGDANNGIGLEKTDFWTGVTAISAVFTYSYDAGTMAVFAALMEDGSTVTFGGVPNTSLRSTEDNFSTVQFDANLVDSAFLFQGGATVAEAKAFASTVIPEPATATLSLLALCGLAARRRRK